MENNYTIEEIEQMSYYDMFSAIDLPFVGIGGFKATNRLAKLCNINKNKNVLFVGCGNGLSALNLAEKVECKIVGVDISKEMIKKANMLTKEKNLTQFAEFKVGDASKLPFEDNLFDAVILEYVVQFFDTLKIYHELKRVLKQGGYLGLNEIYIADDIPEKCKDDIEVIKEVFEDLTGFDFFIRTSSEWKKSYEDTGFRNIKIEEYKYTINIKETLKILGGIKGIYKIIKKLRKYMKSSEIIKNRINTQKKVKQIMRKKPLSNFIGYILCSGKK